MKILLSKTDDHMTLDAARILTNDVTFAGEFNPHNVGLFVVSNEYGAVCAVWASCEQDALDQAVDSDLMESFAAVEESIRFNEEEQTDEDKDGVSVTRLGNGGEPFYLDNCGCRRVPQDDMPVALLIAFAEARGEGADNLDDVKAAGLARVRE
jgi:hypothetical protein